MQNEGEGGFGSTPPDSTASDPGLIYHELHQIIVEQRIQIGRLRSLLADCELERKMAPMPAQQNEKLRAALAAVTWAEELVDAIRIAEEALQS